MFSRANLKKLLIEDYPLLSLLVGTVLIYLSIGPLYNGDTQWEFQAAVGVLKWGMPYTNSFGTLINQMPLGFYFEAVFLSLFGQTPNVGVILITLLALGSTLIVCLIGTHFYGKPTGLLAASLFALSPWELVFSRSFLIDVQCLFLSLLCLYIGILAIHKNSDKYFFLTGIFFAAALFTKAFAIFIIIPLLLFYIYSKPKNYKHILTQLVLFLLPVLLSFLFWFEAVLGQSVFSVFGHSDFSDPNYSGIVPSYFFVGTFLWNYGLGVFFSIAVALSLLVTFSFRKDLSKVEVFDLFCLAMILPIVLIDTVLGAGLNLKAPYNNAIKYTYLSLPFFCLIAASLVSKSVALKANVVTERTKKIVFALTVLSVILFAAVVLVDFGYAQAIASNNYLLFQVEIGQPVGYTLFNTPTNHDPLLMGVQYLGFAIVLSGLLWNTKTSLLSKS
ncbi:MAG: glycosyltransferase family 39 protein [Candidatus Bathyarchaeota archaeon]|nr:glycosyltransferase family 39 protein [Candidatus Bathyarchaeota archaeon]